MKQKIVVKVCVKNQKCRQKALKTVVDQSGVVSAAVQGQEKDKIEIVGDGTDAVALTTSLRKKFGHAELVSVSAVDDKPDGGKSNSTQPNVTGSTPPCTFICTPYYTCEARCTPYCICEARYTPYCIWEDRDPSCTIM